MTRRLDENSEMPFGKYKGKLIKEVLDDDPNYLLWFQDTCKTFVFTPELQKKVLLKAVK